MTKWAHIFLEGFCMFSSMKNKTTKVFRWEDDGTFDEGKVIKNSLYIKANRPNWCKKKFPGRKERVPEFKCLCGDIVACPFFTYCEAEEDDKKDFMKGYVENMIIE